MRRHNENGMILLVCLWVMVILSIWAIGLSRVVKTGIALTRYSIEMLKSDGITWAALTYAAELLQQDTADDEFKRFDTLRACGIKLEEGTSVEDIYGRIPVGGGWFDIRYDSGSDMGNDLPVVHGMRDEEGKINLNALTAGNHQILYELLFLLNIPEDTARTVAASVVDWHDADHKVTDPPFGAEDADYGTLTPAYHCKNRPWDSIEELLLIKGVTPEILSHIRGYVTIFPKKTAKLLVNIETAPEPVITAVIRGVAGESTNTTIEDADSLVAKISDWRNGEDGIPATEDDRRVVFKDLTLNAKERVLFLAIKPMTTSVSHFFRVDIYPGNVLPGKGVFVSAVLYRDELRIVDWRKE